MTPHVTDGNLKIYKITCGPYDNNAYLLVCSRTGESIIIDTPADPEELIAIASTTNVKSILITYEDVYPVSQEVSPVLSSFFSQIVQ